jgi:hypothetical protein
VRFGEFMAGERSCRRRHRDAEDQPQRHRERGEDLSFSHRGTESTEKRFSCSHRGTECAEKSVFSATETQRSAEKRLLSAARGTDRAEERSSAATETQRRREIPYSYALLYPPRDFSVLSVPLWPKEISPCSLCLCVPISVPLWPISVPLWRDLVSL